METLNHLIDANDEKYISQQELNLLKTKILWLNKVLNGYIAYLRKMAM